MLLRIANDLGLGKIELKPDPMQNLPWHIKPKIQIFFLLGPDLARF